MPKPAMAFDIDGTISAHPQFYVQLGEAWVNNGGELHIITARPESDRNRAIYLLIKFGFRELLSRGDGSVKLHFFPKEYPFPFEGDVHEVDALLSAHAAWKAEVCKQHGVTALFEDSAKNLAECRKHGIYGLYVGGFPSFL